MNIQARLKQAEERAMLLQKKADKKKIGIVRDMGDLQRKIDKFLKLAYNILIKTASKGSQGSPSWQICLAKI